MIVKIADIPPEGLDLDFEIAGVELNKRTINAQEKSAAVSFGRGAKVKIHLDLEGSIVSLKGSAKTSFSTACSRCAEDTSQELGVSIVLLAKPASSRAATGEEDEDIQIAYYEGREINFSPIVEEYLMLGLPYCVKCSESCKGLCSNCGINLNTSQCECESKETQTGPFSVLKELKIH